ncbi:MAG: glutaminyl-peptide cyclotransferase [Acidimicrobiia bacterium]|nr:glutaminyl-peptide cyclotransferase [Acidimicrobiia bacterium]
MPRRRRVGSLAASTAAALLALVGCGAQQAVEIRVTTTAATAVEESTTSLRNPHGSTASPTAGEADLVTESSGPVPLLGHFVPVVVAEYPHDPTAWTQGLEWYDGRLLESTGLNGRSSLRLVDVETGRSEELVTVPDDLYAEGATVVDGRAVQLTYRDRTLLVTELSNGLGTEPTQRRADAYDTEGWGLCYDGSRLVMTDGSSQLFFRDAETFELLDTVPVRLAERPIEGLNELECVGDQVLANVWLTNDIVAIDPATGMIEGSIDASALVPEGYEGGPDGAVLNGIAYNHETGTFWLTGKLWPVLYEVSFTPA